MRTRLGIVGTLTVAALALPGPAAAQMSITVSGSPATLRITTATAGSPPVSVMEASTTYTVVNLSGSTRAIRARLSSALPAGVTLTVQLAAPTGATSSGQVTLTTVAQNVVTGVPNLTNQSGLSITYRLSATSAAGVVSLAGRTVTLEIGAP